MGNFTGPSGHVAATAARPAAAPGTVLVLHDTTEFRSTRNTPDGVGHLSYVKGRHGTHTACGMLMHASLALTTAGVPHGLAAVKFRSRKGFKGTNARKRVVNPTTVPIEEKESYRWLENLTRSTRELGDPGRCVHVGDREADISELFHAADQSRTHFRVRTAVARLAGRGGTTVARVMRRQPIRGTHRVEVRDGHGVASSATAHVRFRRVTVHPPVAERKRYGPPSLTVIHAHERGTPTGREPIRWKLLTDLPVDDLSSAIEKLDWHAPRWNVGKNQADCPSRRGWVCGRRIGYHRRDGVARAGRVVPAAPGRPHRRNRVSDTTRRTAPPRA